jgi:choline-glycine betaine transporter
MLVGGLNALKSTVIISAFPMIVIYVFIIISLLKWTKTASNEH